MIDEVAREGTAGGDAATDVDGSRGAGRFYRPVMLGLTAVILVAAVAFGLVTLGAFVREGAVGIDKATHDAFATRWWTTGSMYLPYQLAGPFNAQPLPHVPETMPSMYPPTAAPLFAVFAVLPDILWWVVPIAFTAWVIYRWRPAPWTWPLMAAAVAFPATPSSVWAGNTTMWIVAAVAGGLQYGWPGPFVLLKPSLFPFALAGVWHRAWWFGLAAFVVISIPFLGEWVRYVTVVQNADSSLAYSLGNLPMLLLPVVAWLGRSVRTGSATAS